MTIVPVHALERSDLRRLGRDLPAQVRRDRRAIREAINRSLALHHEQLSDEDALAIEQADPGPGLAA